jgi:hypothetical protein
MPRLRSGFVAMPRRLVVLAALLGAFVSVPAAGAASNVTVLSGLNGTVYSSAVDGSGNRFYGGDFTAVDAQQTRQSAVVDTTTGAPDTSFPAVSGGSTSSVNASVSDGSGGWFIGGSFTCVNSDTTSGCTGAGEVAQVGVAHILANGDIDTSWTAQLAGTSPVAYTMVRIGSTLYVGGAFSNALSSGVSSTTRTNLAAFDTTTGALQSWNPIAMGAPSGAVWSMINNGSTLYVGGAFTSITPVGGSATTRNRFAALDATTGALLTLNPNINGTVRALALDAAAGIVYVGGDFTAATANSWPYKGIVAVNTAGGVNSTWAPNVVNATDGAGVTALAFDAMNSKLYIGGNFTGVYSTSYPRSRLAALSTSSACMSANWALTATRDTCIDAWSPGTLQMSRDVLLTANTPTSLSSNPVMTLSLDGSTLLVGGCFTGIGTTIRRGAARISTTTAAVAAWDPNPSANCVNTILPGSTTTYLGGSFTTTGGTKRAGVVSYDAAGALRAWNPGVDARPTTMELNGSTLYLGGLFNIAGGQQRIQLAGLDLSSGAATGLSISGLSTSTSGNADDTVRDIAVTAAGTTIYVAGLFSCVGDRYAGSCGGTTRGYAAAFATANGALQAWAPAFGGTPVATRLALDADNVYVSGGFSGFVANGTPYTRVGVAAFANDPTTTTVRPWDAGLDAGVWGVATDGTNVYLAGQFSAVQGQPRVQMAAVAAADASTVTPALRAWAPSIGQLSLQGSEAAFLDISADGQYLYGVNQYIRGTNGGTGPRVMTSADGASWTGRSAATDFGFWRSIAFGGGTFVAVASTGAGNRVMTSTDGATWTSRTSAADNTWVSVAYGNGLFVAVANTGTGNRVMTSPDGITWTSRTSAANNEWTSVTYGNGLFVAVAQTGTGNRVMTSPDGITWTSRTSAADIAWTSLAYANGLFVAVANTGTTRLMTSPDGIAWTAGTIEQRAWKSITYGNGRFVAISSESAGGYASTSTNGTAWTTASPLAVTGTFNSVAYGDGQYVAVGSGQGGVNVLTSADGTTWVPQRSGTPSTWTGVAYGGGRFVAVANANLGNRSGGLAVRLGSCVSSWNAATCVSDWDPGLRSGVAVNAFSLLPDGGAVAAVGSFAPVTIGTPTSTRFVLTVDNSSAGSLAVSVGGSGSFNGLPISCGTTCSASFTPGAVVTLVVNTTTGLGYQFSSWGGDCSGTATSCTLTMDAAKSVSVGTATASGATTNTLTLATTGTGTGTITTVPTGATCPGSGAGCTASFASTETLQLVPTATSGAFIGWSGACTGVGACVVTMSQARSVTAEFGPSQTLSLATTGTGGGSIASSNPSGFTCFSTCSRSLPDGATVTLTPIADSTSLFTGWSGACTGTGTCTVPMTQARTVTATFASSVTWTLTTATAGTGSGSISSSPSGITCGATCTASFVDTTSVTLTATASSGSAFTGWSGACTGTGTCTVSMTQARSVTATFATVPTWTLTTSTSGTGTGSISSSPSGISCGATCTASFVDTTSVTLTATAGSGSAFTGWTGACTGTGTCTVSMTQARSVTATFTIVPVDPVSPTTTPVEPAVDPAPANTVTFGVASISPSVGTRNSKTTAALITVVTAPGSGTVRQTASWRVPGRKRAISACRAASTTVAAPGSIQLTCALNAKTRRALQRRSLKVTLRTTFTPVGGTPTKLTRTTTIKRAPRTAAEAVQTTVEAKGPGTITQTGTLATPRARAATRVCTSVLRITKAGTYDVGCALTPYGSELLQRQDLRVTLTTMYTPKGGGKPVTISRVVYLPRTVAPGVTG